LHTPSMQGRVLRLLQSSSFIS